MQIPCSPVNSIGKLCRHNLSRIADNEKMIEENKKYLFNHKKKDCWHKIHLGRSFTPSTASSYSGRTACFGLTAHLECLGQRDLYHKFLSIIIICHSEYAKTVGVTCRVMARSTSLRILYDHAQVKKVLF